MTGLNGRVGDRPATDPFPYSGGMWYDRLELRRYMDELAKAVEGKTATPPKK
jgi:hypothetical protein